MTAFQPFTAGDAPEIKRIAGISIM